MATEQRKTTQAITLEVYVRLKFGARRFDQSAGFSSWARRNHLAPRSRTEWDAQFETFQNTPVGKQS
jgi:hypothetical protein